MLISDIAELLFREQCQKCGVIQIFAKKETPRTGVNILSDMKPF